MNKFILSSVLVGVLSVSSLALAEDKIPRATNAPKSSVVREKMQEQKDRLKKEIKDTKTVIKTEIQNKKVVAKGEAMNLRDDINKKTQEFKDAVKIKKAELEDNIKAKREELHVNLKKIKDVAKQQSVENIDKQIDDLNSQMMAHFSDMLDKMSAVLVKIGDRTTKASQQGYNISSVNDAVGNAKKAIEAAHSAIVTQSGKTYVIKVTTENGLKESVGKARDALHADLTAVKNSVQAAHEAVRKAAVVLGQLRGQSPLPSPTPVSTSSPQATPVH